MKRSIAVPLVGALASVLALAGCASTASTSDDVVQRDAAAAGAGSGVIPTDQAALASYLKRSALDCQSADQKWQKAADADLFTTTAESVSGTPQWPIARDRATGVQALGVALDPVSRMFDVKGNQGPLPTLGNPTTGATCRAVGTDAVFQINRVGHLLNVLRNARDGQCVVLSSGDKVFGREAITKPCASVPSSEAKEVMAAAVEPQGSSDAVRLRVGDWCANAETRAYIDSYDSSPVNFVRCGESSHFNLYQSHGAFRLSPTSHGTCIKVVDEENAKQLAISYWGSMARRKRSQEVEDYFAKASRGDLDVPNLWFMPGCHIVRNKTLALEEFRSTDPSPLTVAVVPGVTVSVSSKQPVDCSSGGKPAAMACDARLAVAAASDGDLRAAFAAARVWNLPVRVKVTNGSGVPIAVSTQNPFDQNSVTSAKSGVDLSGLVPMGDGSTVVVPYRTSTGADFPSPTFARLVTSGSGQTVEDGSIALRIATTSDGALESASTCAGPGDFEPEIGGLECGFIDVGIKIPGGVVGKTSLEEVSIGCRVGGVVDKTSGDLERAVEVRLDKDRPGKASSLVPGGFLPLEVVIRNNDNEVDDQVGCSSAKRGKGSIPTVGYVSVE